MRLSFHVRRAEGHVRGDDMRDFQRLRVYKSEWGCTFYKYEQTIENHDLQSWAEKNVLGRSWFRKRWGNQYPLIELGRSGGRAYTGFFIESRITLGVRCRNPWVMCHEIAHLITSDHHGPQFARTFIFLIERVVGKEQAAELEAKMRFNRVKIAPKNTLPKPIQNPRPYNFTNKAKPRQVKAKTINVQVPAKVAATTTTRKEGEMKVTVKSIKATDENGWSWETHIDRTGQEIEVRQYRTGADRKGLFRYVADTWAPISEDFVVKGRNSVYGKAKRMAMKELGVESKGVTA